MVTRFAGGHDRAIRIFLMRTVGFTHHRLIAETDIATDQARPQSGGKPIQQRPQAGGTDDGCRTQLPPPAPGAD
jgi:hypothetical protein